MSVHFKLKSAKDYETITFEGTSIPIVELKKAIIVKKKFGRSNDYDLLITNAQSNEEYRDESASIPKNTSLIISRVPATMSKALQAALLNNPNNPASGPSGGPGSNNNPSYMGAGGVVPMSAPSLAPAPLIVKEEHGGEGTDQEMARISALYSTQAGFSNRPPAPGTHMPGGGVHRQFPTDRIVAPPPSYICHRCNQPGHYINQCPTNSDPTFNYQRAKKASGIPKIFLRQVHGPPSQVGSTVLMPSGGVAVVLTHDSDFTKYAKISMNNEGKTNSPTHPSGESPSEEGIPKSLQSDNNTTNNSDHQESNKEIDGTKSPTTGGQSQHKSPMSPINGSNNEKESSNYPNNNNNNYNGGGGGGHNYPPHPHHPPAHNIHHGYPNYHNYNNYNNFNHYANYPPPPPPGAYGHFVDPYNNNPNHPDLYDQHHQGGGYSSHHQQPSSSRKDGGGSGGKYHPYDSRDRGSRKDDYKSSTGSSSRDDYRDDRDRDYKSSSTSSSDRDYKRDDRDYKSSSRDSNSGGSSGSRDHREERDRDYKSSSSSSGSSRDYRDDRDRRSGSSRDHRDDRDYRDHRDHRDHRSSGRDSKNYQE